MLVGFLQREIARIRHDQNAVQGVVAQFGERLRAGDRSGKRQIRLAEVVGAVQYHLRLNRNAPFLEIAVQYRQLGRAVRAVQIEQVAARL